MMIASGSRYEEPLVLAITLGDRHRVVVGGQLRVGVDAAAEQPHQLVRAGAAQQLPFLLDGDEQASRELR
jgi:hypothetical protein